MVSDSNVGNTSVADSDSCDEGHSLEIPNGALEKFDDSPITS